MKTTLLCAIALSVSGFGSASAQAPQLTKVDLSKLSRVGFVYRIEDGEAMVAGSLVKRVELGKSSAVITYSNKTSRLLQPKFRFRAFDAYGLEVAQFDDKWILDTVSPGEVQKEEKVFFPSRLDQVLQFSGISLPPDWETPVYLVIEDMQP